MGLYIQGRECEGFVKSHYLKKARGEQTVEQQTEAITSYIFWGMRHTIAESSGIQAWHSSVTQLVGINIMREQVWSKAANYTNDTIQIGRA
jgi:hypothetical protein